jgi:hypothetical protein
LKSEVPSDSANVEATMPALADAGEPLTIKWLSDSFIDIPTGG